MFNNLFLGELKKSFGKVFHLVFGLFFIMVFALLTFSIHEMNEQLNLLDIPPEEDGETFTEEQVDLFILITETQIEVLEKQKKETGFSWYQSNYDQIYLAKASLKYYNYIKDNEMYGIPIDYYAGMDLSGIFMSGGKVTADGYIVQMLAIISSILMIYGIVIASGSFSKEYREGTIKILFLRPITRTKLLISKALSVLTLSSIAYLIGFILTVIMGYSLFPAEYKDMLFSFGGGAFSLLRSDFQIFIAFFVYYIEMMSMIFIGFFMGTLLRNRIWGIVIPMLLSGIGQFIIYTGLARFFITDALNFSQYVGLHPVVTAGSNIFLSLGIYLFYMGGMAILTYFSVTKRDLA